MSRRKRSIRHLNHERWLVSYADFITLLFAFFVVMYSAAQVDKRKVGKIATAIQVAFQQLGPFPTKANPPTLNPQEPGIFSNPPPAGPVPGSEGNSDLGTLQQELEKALAPEISRGEVALRGGPEGLIISLREAGFFDSGSAEIKPSSEPAFSRMAILLAQRNFSVRIEGHTDDKPIHNSQYKSNWELSTARATEAVRLLITEYGFPPEHLAAAGYAEFHPVASNSSDEGRALNRRLDIVVLRKALASEPPVPEIPTLSPN